VTPPARRRRRETVGSGQREQLSEVLILDRSESGGQVWQSEVWAGSVLHSARDRAPARSEMSVGRIEALRHSQQGGGPVLRADDVDVDALAIELDPSRVVVTDVGMR